MKTRAIIALAAAGLIGLCACSQKAQNETAEAADAISADAKATMTEAVNDTDAASEQAFGAAENAIDNVSDQIGNANDAGSDEIEE